jgi:alpha-beta hydrolase superfamily lysophospholipase
MKWEIVQTITEDKIIHQGIYYEPEPKRNLAVLWIHGLTGNFYGDTVLFEEIVRAGKKIGLGFASFNNRGHDMIAGLRTVDPKEPSGFGHAKGGAGQEKFEDCISDIGSGINFLSGKGYKKIILVGHSTGAMKAGFYAGTKIDPRLTGVVLASPMSDRLIALKTDPKVETTVRKMKRMVQKGKGDYLLNNLIFFPITPKRFISLFDRSLEENLFDYGEKAPRMEIYSKIKKPLLVVFAEKDEYADRPVEKIQAVFDKFQKTVSYKSLVLPGATHGYDGQEKAFALALVDWLNNFKA